jgi:hypothetical protein
VAAVKRDAHALRHDVATARGALFPLGKPQERALNALPILARTGRDCGTRCSPAPRTTRTHSSTPDARRRERRVTPAPWGGPRCSAP